jgi:hypothetical protein
MLESNKAKTGSKSELNNFFNLSWVYVTAKKSHKTTPNFPNVKLIVSQREFNFLRLAYQDINSRNSSQDLE